MKRSKYYKVKQQKPKKNLEFYFLKSFGSLVQRMRAKNAREFKKKFVKLSGSK